MSDRPLRVRFAPSPTGSLHLGNARTALFNWLVARRGGGAFVLRIEDTDTARETEGSEASILEDLRWLGLGWDEGPDVGGSFGPYRQSERSDLYRRAAERLLAQGDAYRCFCSDEQLEADREELRRIGAVPRYSGRCRTFAPEEAQTRVASGEPCAIRFATFPTSSKPSSLTVSFVDRLRGNVEFPLAELGDPVLLRRDGRPTYNFAVVVDDATMEMSLVLRGDDHLSNTPRQVLLYRALGHEVPEFAHLPMVRGADGERLSKRHGAVSVSECRRRGVPPEALVNALALLGWAPTHDRTILSLQELLEEFDLDRVSRSPGIFDPVKLDWVSSQHVHRLPIARLAEETGERLVQAGLLPEEARIQGREWLEGVTSMLREAVERFDQIPARCESLFARGGRPEELEALVALEAPQARRTLETMALRLVGGEPATRDAWKQLVEAIRQETGLKGKALYLPIRVALTGHASGPELDHLVPLIAQGHDLFPEQVASVASRVKVTLEAIS